ncbi:pseudoazurin [Actinobacillus pleuropneumoniae]|uniref:Pseudoazurin n=1 Tax=Actinobacillus pleuropneumoniae serovar 6 str. Femo TaxID=754256 RepID=A0A828PSJ4_ACTPL|nr:pseudoazurin [Actinobacillus pleuropneumoniae]EFL81264.1 pseudoazurin [Actinobacillus pleuropneumoniae serovar 6 str. Femo]EFM91200.1 Plastocyanin [Actinobacillus pleuropneumoniae serovar 6 str. Femo]UKH12034.1 pseudoazurin [Actinobacillus pleuropneumoniae serovar 6 str. Femo]SUU53291.1 plastocyanin [Actinobacillus pleuropneumoniae]
MKKVLLASLLVFSGSVLAADHEVKMLDSGKDGGMVFEPGFVKAEVGDTVTFIPTHKGHWVQSRAIPEGAEKFLSKENEKFSLTLTHEGVYVYVCPPHRMMNMSGIIQVGKPINLENATKEIEKIEKRTTENKGRLFEYLDQVK